MGILRLDTQGHWAVDGQPIYPPSIDPEFDHESAVSNDSGRLEDGFMWKRWVRRDIRKVSLTYNALTGAEKDYLKELMQGKDFTFTYYDNGVQVISSAYSAKMTYKGHSTSLFASEGGVYIDLKIDVVEN